jgi:tetratricopeptide (TPR) repeat protein
MEPYESNIETGIPFDPGTTYAAAKELFGQKRFAEVVALCERAESSGRYDANVVAVHSASLLKLSRTSDVIALLESMLYYFPNDARLHMNLGTAYTAVFRSSEGKYEYEVAKKLDPVIVGQKVTRLLILRISIATSAFLAFFLSMVFWPHTRWLLVALIGLMIALSWFVLYGAVKRKGKERLVARPS